MANLFAQRPQQGAFSSARTTGGALPGMPSPYVPANQQGPMAAKPQTMQVGSAFSGPTQNANQPMQPGPTAPPQGMSEPPGMPPQGPPPLGAPQQGAPAQPAMGAPPAAPAMPAQSAAPPAPSIPPSPVPPPVNGMRQPPGAPGGRPAGAPMQPNQVQPNAFAAR